ncbi:tetratricopeptide repeat protein [Fundidesulfovibrio soli]|uniref:tetratricopeptide repeat protein n=1 Tax=Fundidesulfovibrio soli TaxID=2922716 RepID=UPI001FAF0FC7
MEDAIKAAVYGLYAYIKHSGVLIRQEKKEYQELLTKAVHLISLDPLVKQMCSEPLEYVPRNELQLLSRMRQLPEQIRSLHRDRLQQAETARLQSRSDRMEKGRQLIAQKYFDGAVQHLGRLSAEFADDAALQAQIGKMLFDINHIECITYFEKAVALDPQDHGSLAMMGVAFRKIRQFDNAERAYLAALERDQDNVNYLFNLSRVYIDAGKWTNAQETLRRVLDIDPTLGPARKALEFATRHCRDLM